MTFSLFCCLGVCLEPAAKDHRVVEQVAALEEAMSDIKTFWSDTRRRHAVVLLQDRAQHIDEAVEGCRRALMTMFSVMLLRNHFPTIFHELLDVFRSSRHIHHLIELNLIAGANFALAWVLKSHSQLDFDSISRGLPPRRSRSTTMRVHVDATIEPARRIIACLLQADASFSEKSITWIRFFLNL
jgi:hypothetical protein